MLLNPYSTDCLVSTFYYLINVYPHDIPACPAWLLLLRLNGRLWSFPVASYLSYTPFVLQFMSTQLASQSLQSITVHFAL